MFGSERGHWKPYLPSAAGALLSAAFLAAVFHNLSADTQNKQPILDNSVAPGYAVAGPGQGPIGAEVPLHLSRLVMSRLETIASETYTGSVDWQGASNVQAAVLEQCFGGKLLRNVELKFTKGGQAQESLLYVDHIQHEYVVEAEPRPLQLDAYSSNMIEVALDKSASLLPHNCLQE